VVTYPASDAADNGADGDTGCWLSATPGGRVKFNLFLDIFLRGPVEEYLLPSMMIAD